jgi:hypothetical protein
MPLQSLLAQASSKKYFELYVFILFRRKTKKVLGTSEFPTLHFVLFVQSHHKPASLGSLLGWNPVLPDLLHRDLLGLGFAADTVVAAGYA